jgi:hypothetical protein
MANCPTPSIERILELLKYAKSKLSCPIQLGCMRPSGEPRKIIDIVSWMSGVDKIVMPDHRLIKTLEKFNIPIIQTNECCAFNRANNE